MQYKPEYVMYLFTVQGRPYRVEFFHGRDKRYMTTVQRQDQRAWVMLATEFNENAELSTAQTLLNNSINTANG